MADYVTKIRTSTGEKQIDYNALANKNHAEQHCSEGTDPILPESIGAISLNEKGAPNGVAALDASGKISVDQMPGDGIVTDIFSVGTTAPSNTKLLWIDTTATTGGLKYYNGSAWVHVPVAFT